MLLGIRHEGDDILKDMEIAKKLLTEENLTMVVVKDGQVIFKSKDKGIKPIFILATEMREEAKGAILADRVIGKGAAVLSGYIGIKEIYSELISEVGVKVLEDYKIPHSMNGSCKYIKNRDKTDYCPIEKISMNIEDPIILIQSIKEFFKEINRGEI